MTPDTAALRALADAATPGPWHWRNTQGRNGSIYLQGARTRIVMAFKRMGMAGAQPMFRREDGLLYESAEANINAFPDAAYIAALDPDTVRALCDAADEVERLRDEVASLRTLRMEINQGFGSPATIKVWRDNVLRFNGVDLSALMERDASRTAHAALVAELRALHKPEGVPDSGHFYCDPDDCNRAGEGVMVARCVTCETVWPCDTAAVLDRHAPEEK